MDAGKQFEATDNAPFKIITYPGTERVQYIQCLVCNENIFDDARDSDMGTKSLTDVAVLHLTLTHGDQFEPAKER
jgi:hypothetical protein